MAQTVPWLHLSDWGKVFSYDLDVLLIRRAKKYTILLS